MRLKELVPQNLWYCMDVTLIRIKKKNKHDKRWKNYTSSKWWIIICSTTSVIYITCVVIHIKGGQTLHFDNLIFTHHLVTPNHFTLLCLFLYFLFLNARNMTKQGCSLLHSAVVNGDRCMFWWQIRVHKEESSIQSHWLLRIGSLREATQTWFVSSLSFISCRNQNKLFLFPHPF